MPYLQGTELVIWPPLNKHTYIRVSNNDSAVRKNTSKMGAKGVTASFVFCLKVTSTKTALFY